MAAVSPSLHEPVTSDLGLSDVTSLTSSRDSPPPTAARLPPDGHEFPPDFSLSETPSESRPNELAKVTSRVHRRGHDLRSPEFGGFSRDQRPRSMLFESRSEPRSRGCQRSESLVDYESGREQRRFKHPSENDLRQLSNKLGGVRASVRDRIALFSSVSKEKLTEPKQIPSGRDGNETVGKGSRQSQTKDQERSKSDLKLTGNETQKLNSGYSSERRKKISDPFGVISTGGTHWPTGMPKMVNNGFSRAQETPSVVSQCSIHISRSHSRESSAGRSHSSEERDVCTNSLSERSQSLLDLGRVEKRHSYAGLNRQGPVADLPRKTSLNSIIEERKKSFSKLRGLIIPNKVDGVTKRGPADMPAIKSKELPALSKTSSQMLSPMHSPRPKHPTIEQVDRRETHYLASPPWKVDSPSNIPKYSPAFKRKNVSVYTSSPRSSGSAFCSVSSSSRLGGSSIELSRSPSTHEVSADSSLHRLHVRSLQQKIMEPGREPLQRSSSLNSRPTGISGETRRRVSDDLPGSRRHPVGEEDGDVGSSTLTLVAEPLDELTVSNTELRSRANSVEFDYRASTSTLHGSPVKDIDIEEEFRINSTHRESIKEEEEPRSLSDDELSLIKLKTSESKNTSVSRSGSSVSSHHERPDKLSGSPPKIQEDGAWRKFASNKDSASLNPPTGESRDLTKLRQSTTKPSVKSLKERWQMLSGESDSSVSPTSPTRAPPTSLSRSPSTRSDRTEAVAPTRSEPAPPPSTAPAPLPSKEGAPTSVRDVVDRNWPSIESERADIDRKLSTPTYGDATLRQRDRKGRVPSRPQSWVENEKELKVFEMGGLIGGGSAVSTSSSQENIMDALDAAKSPSGSTSSLLEMLTANLKNTARSKHVLSVSDLRRAFERSDSRTGGAHLSLSAMEANGSEEGHATHQGGSTASLHSTKEHYGSITSLASSTSLISPHELQQLIEEANQSLEEAGTPSHEIIVAVIHREMMGGSVGITLAGGADYENKEISVNKVITGSVADRDGRIKKGDRVISINGRSMKNTTHREALNVLKAPRAEVVLVLSRSRSVTPSSATDEPGVHRPSVINTFSSRPPKILESPMDSKSLVAALEFNDVPRGSPAEITLFKEGAGVGFSLEGGKDSPMGDRPLVAKKIFTGGAADKNGQLQVGDQILAINGEDVTNMPRIEAWNFLKKQPEGPLKLTIRKRVAHTSAPAATSIEKTAPPAGAAEGAPPQNEHRSASRPVVAGVTPKVAMATPEVVLPKA